MRREDRRTNALQTDRQTDRPTDRASFRGALSHLKNFIHISSMDMRGFLFVLKENIPGRAEVSGGTGAVIQKLFGSSSRAYHRASDDANRHWSRPKLFYGSGEGGLSSECGQKRFLHLVM